MKSKLIATICLLALGLAVARAQEVKSNAAASAPAASTFTDAQMMEELGWWIGKRAGLSELEFSKEDIDHVLKGLAAAAAGKDSPYDLDKIGPAMDEVLAKVNVR